MPLFRSALLLAVAIATSPVIAAAPPLSVDTRVKVGHVGADFHIRVHVEPHEANRTVCLHADLNTFPDVFKACWNADGLQGTKTTWRWLKDCEAGKWEVYATVDRIDGKTLSSPRMLLTVYGPGYDEPDPFPEP